MTALGLQVSFMTLNRTRGSPDSISWVETKKATPRKNSGSTAGAARIWPQRDLELWREAKENAGGTKARGGRPSNRMSKYQPGVWGQSDHLGVTDPKWPKPSDGHQQARWVLFSFHFMVSLFYSVKTKLYLGNFYLVFRKHFCAYFN